MDDKAEELREQYKGLHSTIFFIEENTAMRETIKKLNEALEFYGNADEYYTGELLINSRELGNVIKDCGQKAREAIELAKPYLDNK